jgi:hypothetical protein
MIRNRGDPSDNTMKAHRELALNADWAKVESLFFRRVVWF